MSREELELMIEGGLAEYDDDVRAEWARIRIEPEKWRCSPWGDPGGGFWVVATDHGQVLWFNDIEDGFNWSPFAERGTIGEYYCDQTEFTEILERIALAQSERTRAMLRESDVPSDLVGPGTIVKRQTTYWEVRASDAVYRVHFREKVEAAFVASGYPTMEIETRHPLLVAYDDPSRFLYFSGTALDPGTIAESLNRVIWGSVGRLRSRSTVSTPLEPAGLVVALFPPVNAGAQNHVRRAPA